MSCRNWDEIVDSGSACIAKNTGIWRREKGFDTGWHNFGEKLMLVVTEIGEVVEASDNIRYSLAKFNGASIDSVQSHFGAFFEYLLNYVEEWIDVMVRIYDLAEACGVVIGSIGWAAVDDLGRLSASEVVVKQSSVNVAKVIRSLSLAMEVFRDIRLVESNGQIVPLDIEENKNIIRKIGEYLTQAASVSASSVNNVGANWRREYARKMKKNEERPIRHGRER